MKGRPRKIDESMRARILEVGRLRRTLKTLPSNKQLAREAGCSTSGIEYIMYQLPRENIAPRGTLDLDTLAEEVRRVTRDGPQ
jgi:DNA-binding transcriptional MocR family regulator